MLFSDIYDISIVNYNIVIAFSKRYIVKKALMNTALMTLFVSTWVAPLFYVKEKPSDWFWFVPVASYGIVLFQFVKDMRNRMVIELDIANKRINVQAKHDYDNSNLEYIRIDYRADSSGYMHHYLAFINAAGKAFTIVKGKKFIFSSPVEELELLAQKISEHTGIPIHGKSA